VDDNREITTVLKKLLQREDHDGFQGYNN
jgi:hypothetical protein